MVSSINRFMDRFLLSMIDLNILLVYLSFIYSSLFEVKVACFSIACITALFSDYFLMPKDNPNDKLYTIESSFIVLFRFSSLSFMTIVLIDEGSILFPLSIIISTIIVLYLAYQFYKYGTIIYNNSTSALLLYIKYSFFIAITITISFKIFTPIVLKTPIALFITICLIINSKSNSYELYPNIKEEITFEGLKAIKVINKRLSASLCPERKIMRIGQLQIHMQNCLISNCFCKKSQIYCTYIVIVSDKI